MGYKPKTRREALLYELCVRLGYCSTGLVPADLAEDMDTDQVTRMVIEGEFGQDRLEVLPQRLFDEVHREVAAWLFGSKGRQSGLPF